MPRLRTWGNGLGAGSPIRSGLPAESDRGRGRLGRRPHSDGPRPGRTPAGPGEAGTSSGASCGGPIAACPPPLAPRHERTKARKDETDPAGGRTDRRAKARGLRETRSVSSFRPFVIKGSRAQSGAIRVGQPELDRRNPSFARLADDHAHYPSEERRDQREDHASGDTTPWRATTTQQ